MCHKLTKHQNIRIQTTLRSSIPALSSHSLYPPPHGPSQIPSNLARPRDRRLYLAPPHRRTRTVASRLVVAVLATVGSCVCAAVPQERGPSSPSHSGPAARARPLIEEAIGFQRGRRECAQTPDTKVFARETPRRLSIYSSSTARSSFFFPILLPFRG